MSDLIVNEDSVNRFDKWMSEITSALVPNGRLTEVRIGFKENTREPYLSFVGFVSMSTVVSLSLPNTTYSFDRKLELKRNSLNLVIDNCSSTDHYFTEEVALAVNVDKHIVRTVNKLENNITFDRLLSLKLNSIKPHEVDGVAYTKLHFDLLLSDVRIEELELLVDKGKVNEIILDGKSFNSLGDLRQYYYSLIDYGVSYKSFLRGMDGVYGILVDYLTRFLSRRIEEIENDKQNT